MSESVYCVLVTQLVDGGDDIRRVDSVWTDADDARARAEAIGGLRGDGTPTVTEHVLNSLQGESYIDEETVISVEDVQTGDRGPSGESGLDAYTDDDDGS